MKTDTTLPAHSLRDDLRHRPEAIARGWTPELSVHDRESGIDPVSGVAAWPVQFHRMTPYGKRILWRIKGGWRAAELKDGHYVNHRTHPDFLTALEKETPKGV